MVPHDPKYPKEKDQDNVSKGDKFVVMSPATGKPIALIQFSEIDRTKRILCHIEKSLQEPGAGPKGEPKPAPDPATVIQKGDHVVYVKPR